MFATRAINTLPSLRCSYRQKIDFFMRAGTPGCHSTERIKSSVNAISFQTPIVGNALQISEKYKIINRAFSSVSLLQLRESSF